MKIKPIQPPDCDEQKTVFDLTLTELTLLNMWRDKEQWYASLSRQERLDVATHLGVRKSGNAQRGAALFNAFAKTFTDLMGGR